MYSNSYQQGSHRNTCLANVPGPWLQALVCDDPMCLPMRHKLALQERCEALAKELLAVDGRLQSCMDVAALRKAGKCSGHSTFLGVLVRQQKCPNCHLSVNRACIEVLYAAMPKVEQGCCELYPLFCVVNLQACSMLQQLPRCLRRSWQAAPTLTQHSTA